MMNNRRNRGFTLIEIMIGIAIMVGILLAIYSTLFQTNNAYLSGMSIADLREKARLVTAMMAEDIRHGSRGGLAGTASVPVVISAPGLVADGGTIVAGAPGGDAIEFYKATGVDDITLVPTFYTRITYSTIPEDGETAGDDIDNNNNGLIDEQILVRTEETWDGAAWSTPPTVTIAMRDLQEGTLRFERDGSVVETSLTLQRRDHHYQLIQATCSTMGDLRNP